MTDDFDDLFKSAVAGAKDARPEPPAPFMARVLQDGLDVQDQLMAAERAALAGAATGRGAVQAGLIARIGEFLGGWPAVAGLASAAVVGVWIGVNPPSSLSDPFGATLDTTALSEIFEPSGFDFTEYEG
jgi:hypothetical protein